MTSLNSSSFNIAELLVRSMNGTPLCRCWFRAWAVRTACKVCPRSSSLSALRSPEMPYRPFPEASRRLTLPFLVIANLAKEKVDVGGW